MVHISFVFGDLFLFYAVFVIGVRGQCTFGTTFNGTTWRDNTRGDVTFSETTMSKWTHSPATVLEFPTWTCVNFTADSLIVLRTSVTVTLSSGSSAYAYICMKLTAITDYSFMYYLQSLQQPELAYERVTISSLTTLTQDDVCDLQTTVPMMEYHVIVKSGFERNAAIQCPNSLLFSADYVYYGSDGTTACDTSTDTWNVCTDRSLMTFDYTTCSQQIAFSAGGVLWCVASVRSTYDYTVVYNNDTTVTGTSTEQFSCIVADDTQTFASIAPRNCSITQTPTTFAIEGTQQADIGHRLVIGTKYPIASEDSTSGLSAGVIAAIVLTVLYIIFMWTVTTTIIIIILIWISFQFFVIFLELTGNFDFSARKTPTLSYIDIPEPEMDHKAAPVLDDVVTPSDVDLRKGDKLMKRGTLLPIIETKQENNANGKVPDIGKQKLFNETETADSIRKNVDLPAIHKAPLIKMKRKFTPR